jgi:hypothetical protein
MCTLPLLLLLLDLIADERVRVVYALSDAAALACSAVANEVIIAAAVASLGVSNPSLLASAHGFCGSCSSAVCGNASAERSQAANVSCASCQCTNGVQMRPRACDVRSLHNSVH